MPGPSDLDFEGLRKRAKSWHRALRSGNETSGEYREQLERLERVLPRHADPPRLREVQQALARELGFASWTDLKAHHETGVATDRHDRVDVFLEYACIFSEPQDLPVKWRRAERILARHPEIAKASIHTAVVCGEVEHVRALLDAEPALVERRGGPQRWEPLLFACHGRLPTRKAAESSLEVARLLLDAGADPNTRFVMPGDWKLRFSALTGVMGQGEMGQPEHPQADALARLLLERGANPNDSQGLYNTHLIGDDTRWLDLLFQHGLGPDDPIDWHDDAEAARLSGADRARSILDYLVCGAARNGHVKRLKRLLEQGADPNARSIYDGKTSHQHALLAGSAEAAETLRRFGADAIGLEGHDAFVAAVRAGDRAGAEARLAGHPEYLEIADPLTEAAARDDAPVVALLLELGVDPNRQSRHGHRALNNACENREIAELLLRHGADPRGRAFGGTACGWARHAGNLELARFHAERSRSLLDAATCGHLELARELLDEDPGQVHERSPAGNTPLHELAVEADLAEPLLELLLGCGADPAAVNEAGQTPAGRLEEMGADEVADLLEAVGEAAD